MAFLSFSVILSIFKYNTCIRHKKLFLFLFLFFFNTSRVFCKSGSLSGYDLGYTWPVSLLHSGWRDRPGINEYTRTLNFHILQDSKKRKTFLTNAILFGEWSMERDIENLIFTHNYKKKYDILLFLFGRYIGVVSNLMIKRVIFCFSELFCLSLFCIVYVV